ncbi:MurR/RpiR family transcriptional regulator [Youngiibacter fragilis]|uniref:RpiR family transcriptional regulator n=1 Tax=Youngiibacter fragilis 232.1 TaxID=994573 RepID=V7I1J2_9CLOT|nr:MurR/RpiR family transcriptional regulator [Youngiibacter fragilis]ETA79738.1 RpiR family transcriptional regulator [Youngiibacter fragilis 232.1]
MYLFQLITETSLKYKDARKTIAEFILQEKNDLTYYSMKEIADLTFTSKPTLVRFAKALGFSGWREFMVAFLDELHQQESHYAGIDSNLPFKEDDSTSDIIRKISELEIESIHETTDLMEVPTLELAVKRLLSANRIALFGISPNTLVGELFRRKMQSIGKIVNIPMIDEGGTFSHSLGPNDCAIILSYSGNNESREPMSFIRILKENEVPLIGITSGGKNYIRENIDCVFTISSRERLYSKISNFSTEVSVLSIFNIIFSLLFCENYQKNLEYKIKASRKLEYRRNADLNEMREDSSENKPVEKPVKKL